MLNQPLLAELRQEAESTRKMLDRVPFDKKDWKPHEKSFTLGKLASHVAYLLNWLTYTIQADEMDFANTDYKEPEPGSHEELMELVRKHTAEATKALEGATDERLLGSWSLRSGEKIFFTMPRITVIRSFALNHLIHHRGQLSVYLRLLDVPVPGMYGPTADEPM